jgi:hypothetical protein
MEDAMLLSFTTLNIVISSFLIVAVAVYAVRSSLIAAGWGAERVSRAVVLVSTLLGGWLAAALILTSQGAYTATATGLPTIQYGIFLPIIAGVALYWSSAFVREIIAAVPQSWLIGIQFYRALGVNFLLLYSAAQLPGLFALPAGIGDIIVGVTALAIVWTYRNGTPPDRLVRRWNAFGIADLAVAVGTGFMTSPSALQVAAFDAPNQMITEFPLALVPAFAVPLAILLHLASLAKTKSARCACTRVSHA